ncbi:MAG TPA: 3-hydroxy-5-phosphonooxypentane-2,4-dione thiolase LsrF [Candidatus Goldiibacteriota bacterium]|nr:3-hydroxy-5-phosphonooxypentane-2,4-dione thiolase LsrF [Candidatus Goldiibacteriota bacterium]
MKKITQYKAEWSGLTNRLAQMFDAKSGRTVLLAVDHGYFQGAPSGLEDLRKTIDPLLPFCDAFSPTVGGLKIMDPWCKTPVILRATGGNSMRRPSELDDEIVTVSIEQILKANAVGFTASCYIGLPRQKQTIENLAKLTNEGHKYGLISIGITAVGGDPVLGKFVKGEREDGGALTKEDKKEAIKYLKHAARVVAENGADIVKTYYSEGFEEVVEACPVPIVIAGGTKRPTEEALEFTYNAIKAGAVGVDMGRNIFQNENPVAMIQAVRGVVHEGMSVKEALKLYKGLAKK